MRVASLCPSAVAAPGGLGLQREKRSPGASDPNVAVTVSLRRREEEVPQSPRGKQRLLSVGLRHPLRQSSLYSSLENTSQGCSSVMWHRMTAFLYEGLHAHCPLYREKIPWVPCSCIRSKCSNRGLRSRGSVSMTVHRIGNFIFRIPEVSVV